MISSPISRKRSDYILAFDPIVVHPASPGICFPPHTSHALSFQEWSRDADNASVRSSGLHEDPMLGYERGVQLLGFT